LYHTYSKLNGKDYYEYIASFDPSNGKKLSSFQTCKLQFSSLGFRPISPAMDNNSILHLISNNCTYYAFDVSSGAFTQLLNGFPLALDCTFTLYGGAPTIAADGTVYIATPNDIYAYKGTTLKWSITNYANYPYPSQPAISANGSFATCDPKECYFVASGAIQLCANANEVVQPFYYYDTVYTCATSCPAGFVVVNGICVECPSGQVELNGECVTAPTALPTASPTALDDDNNDDGETLSDGAIAGIVVGGVVGVGLIGGGAYFLVANSGANAAAATATPPPPVENL
jgi:hypothetical protein